jgi:indoleamine 2,3-dioxygenase
MHEYMPRHHRNFIRYLGAVPRPLRAAVVPSDDAARAEAYNAAMDALRRSRDAHLCIVALYIASQPHCSAATSAPSPRAEGAAEACADQLSIWIGTVGVATVPGLLGGTDH